VYHDDNRTISSSTRVAHTTEITISQDTFDPLKNLGIGLHAYFMSQSWLMKLSGILLMIGLVMMVGLVPTRHLISGQGVYSHFLFHKQLCREPTASNSLWESKNQGIFNVTKADVYSNCTHMGLFHITPIKTWVANNFKLLIKSLIVHHFKNNLQTVSSVLKITSNQRSLRNILLNNVLVKLNAH
jgi:two-component sensor histidine kinase